MKKTLNFLGILILAAIALLLGRYIADAGRQNGSVDPAALEKLSRLSLPDTQHTLQPLKQWQGKVQVINFWATWCPPCRAEMPGFSHLQEAQGKAGVQFVGIGVDSAENIDQFAKSNPVSYPLLHGGNNMNELMRQLGNKRIGLPFTLVIAADGRVIAAKIGAVSENEMQRLIVAAQGKS